MEIRIHTQSGSVETFLQDNPAVVASILKGIQCTRIFTSDTITIAGQYSLTTFIASRVNRIDFLTDELPVWKHPTDILDVVELSEEEFRERSHLNDPTRLERRRSPKQAGEVAVVFVEVETTGGKRIYLAAKIKVALEAERLQRLHMMFSAPALHFRLPEGGAAILNLKNIVRFTLNPGPDRAPIDAWLAHHLSRHEQSGCIANAVD